MIMLSKFIDSRSELCMVLPEPQYHALLCVHLTNMEALKSHGFSI